MNFRIHDFENLTSTLDEAQDKKYKHLDVITARFQTAGRGQRGNKWLSSKGKNLMSTFVFEPTHIAVNEQFMISMITALAVASTVRSFGVERVMVKWPNDIYVGEGKIAGILIEHSFSSAMLSRSIVGVGINVCQTQFDEGAGNPTSLNLLGCQATVEEVLLRLCGFFEHYFECDVEDLHHQYMETLYRAEGFHKYMDKDGQFLARIVGVDPHSGVMSLMDDGGVVRSYYFKEVSYVRD